MLSGISGEPTCYWQIWSPPNLSSFLFGLTPFKFSSTQPLIFLLVKISKLLSFFHTINSLLQVGLILASG